MKSEYIKEMQELAALKAENERLRKELELTKSALQLVNISSEALWKENERLKELYTTYVLQCEKLAADKAELKEILYEVYNRYASLMSTKMQDKLKGVLSKHDTKRPD